MVAEPDFDVIVIGAGIAGSVCAYQLANAGYEVALVERGETPGSKNLSGGVFYCRVMEQVFPNFTSEAPIERIITRNNICLLNESSMLELNYRDQRLADPINAVTVLRAKLDSWLAEQCEAAGVSVVPGMHVDRLLVDRITPATPRRPARSTPGSPNPGGPLSRLHSATPQICGIGIGEDEITARVVVAADGINSFLARSIGLRQKEPNKHLAVGIKSVIRLPAKRIEERFQLTGNDGAAWAVVGDCTAGVGGGGFLYTNHDTLSIGVVLRLDDLVKKNYRATDLHDRFLQHPYVAPYLEGGTLQEYGCHLVAEGGYQMLGKQVTDGLLVIGDAGGYTLNTGLTIRGMDLAAGSAIAAAKTIDRALQRDDTSSASLKKYTEYLDESFVGQDMYTYRLAPQFLESPELYGQIGQLTSDVFYSIYNHDLSPRRPLVKTVLSTLRRSPIPWRRVAQIAWQGGRSL